MPTKPSIFQRAKAAVQILAGYHMQEWSTKRRSFVRPSQTARRDIPYAVRAKMLDWSRELERKDPLFNRFLDLNEQYVVGPHGLKIVSASRDTVAAQLMTDVWHDWQPWCDIGSLHPFGLIQGLMTRELCVAGEVFIFLTFGATGRPRIQLIPPELVLTPPKIAADKAIIDGVRQEPTGRPIGYYVKPDTDNPKDDWPMIPAERMVHMFDPSRICQARGLPIVYPVI
jgi:capsid protein